MGEIDRRRKLRDFGIVTMPDNDHFYNTSDLIRRMNGTPRTPDLEALQELFPEKCERRHLLTIGLFSDMKTRLLGKLENPNELKVAGFRKLVQSGGNKQLTAISMFDPAAKNPSELVASFTLRRTKSKTKGEAVLLYLETLHATHEQLLQVINCAWDAVNAAENPGPTLAKAS